VNIDRSLFAGAGGVRFVSPTFSTGSTQGDRRAQAIGQGSEFADHRPYQPGDDLRRVDWNAYTRLSTLLIRLYHADRDQRIHLYIDATGSMGVDDKLDRAGTIAMCLALVGLHHRDRVVVGCLRGDATPVVVSGQDTRALPGMLHALAPVQASGSNDLRSAMLRCSGERRADRGILLSDLLMSDEELITTMRTLAATAARPAVIQVLGPSDLTPTLRGALELQDAETGRKLRVAGSRKLEEAYAVAFSAWQKRVAAAAARYRVQLITAPTTVPVRTILTEALRKAGILEGQAR
jgi:uncharacterized protein (DUF58 family)